MNSQQSPEITLSLAPRGPLALVYVGAFYGAGRYFGALISWLVVRLGIARALGISLTQREMRDELEPGVGLLGGSVYLCYWLINVLGIGPFP